MMRLALKMEYRTGCTGTRCERLHFYEEVGLPQTTIVFGGTLPKVRTLVFGRMRKHSVA